MFAIQGYKIIRKIRSNPDWDVILTHSPSGEKRVFKSAAKDSTRYNQAQKMLNYEYKMLAQLGHPLIVKTHGCHKVSQGTCLELDYIEGYSLREALVQAPGQVWTQQRDIILSITSALEHLEEHGIVHQDLKPENIIVTNDGKAILIDFSIAKTIKRWQWRKNIAVQGTRAYMAPEQIYNQKTDPRTDMYALGIIIYEILAGQVPFSGNSPEEILDKQLNDNPRPLCALGRGIAPRVDAVIMQLLAKKPEERFPLMSMARYNLSKVI